MYISDYISSREIIMKNYTPIRPYKMVIYFMYYLYTSIIGISR